MPDQDKPPPQCLDSEQATLGACLVDPQAALIALGIVGPEDFYREAHRLVFAAMKQAAG
ncbi:unnamed protein product, partial [marine sediment metagenome]